METSVSPIPKWNDEKAESIVQDVTIDEIRKAIQSLKKYKTQVVAT